MQRNGTCNTATTLTVSFPLHNIDELLPLLLPSPLVLWNISLQQRQERVRIGRSRSNVVSVTVVAEGVGTGDAASYRASSEVKSTGGGWAGAENSFTESMWPLAA